MQVRTAPRNNPQSETKQHTSLESPHPKSNMYKLYISLLPYLQQTSCLKRPSFPNNHPHSYFRSPAFNHLYRSNSSLEKKKKKSKRKTHTVKNVFTRSLSAKTRENLSSSWQLPVHRCPLWPTCCQFHTAPPCKTSRHTHAHQHTRTHPKKSFKQTGVRGSLQHSPSITSARQGCPIQPGTALFHRR